MSTGRVHRISNSDNTAWIDVFRIDSVYVSTASVNGGAQRALIELKWDDGATEPGRTYKEIVITASGGKPNTPPIKINAITEIRMYNGGQESVWSFQNDYSNNGREFNTYRLYSGESQELFIDVNVTDKFTRYNAGQVDTFEFKNEDRGFPKVASSANALTLDPFQQIIGFYWPEEDDDQTGVPGISCPLYIVVSIVFANEPVIYVPEIENTNLPWTAGGPWVTPDPLKYWWVNYITSVSYKIKVANLNDPEIPDVFCYYGDPDNEVDGRWFIESAHPTRAQWNTQIFDVAGVIEGYPRAIYPGSIVNDFALNFDHASDAPRIDVPAHPWYDPNYPREPRDSFYEKFDVHAYLWTDQLSETTERHYAFTSLEGIEFGFDERYSLNVNTELFNIKNARSPISDLPLNVTYNGIPLQMVGCVTDETNQNQAGDGLETSNYVDILYRVPMCENPVEEFMATLYLRQYYEDDVSDIMPADENFVPDQPDPGHTVSDYDWDWRKMNRVRSVNSNGTADATPWTAWISYSGVDGYGVSMPPGIPAPIITHSQSFPVEQTWPEFAYTAVIGIAGAIREGGSMAVGPPEGYTGSSGPGAAIPANVPCVLSFSQFPYEGATKNFFYLNTSQYRAYRLPKQGIEGVTIEIMNLLPDPTIEYLGATYNLIEWSWDSTGFPDEPFYGWYGGRKVTVRYKRQAQ